MKEMPRKKKSESGTTQPKFPPKELLEEKAYLHNGVFGFVFKKLKGYALQCELCDTRISSTATSFKQHTLGRKHIRELNRAKMRQKGVPQKPKTSLKKIPELSYDTSIQESLDTIKENLIGLEYLLEVVALDDIKKPVYFCALCLDYVRLNQSSPATAVVIHLKEYRHKINYLRVHFPITFEHLNPLLTNTLKVKSSHSKTIVDRIVDAIEKTYGRLKPARVDPLKFHTRRNIYLDALRKVKHHEESPGHTFEHLITRYNIFDASKDMPKTDNMSTLDKPLPTERRNFSLDNRENSVKTGNLDIIKIRENRIDHSSNLALPQRVKIENQEMNQIHNHLEEELMKYKENPEDHPQYNNEWQKFWKEKYMELKAQGKDPSTYDFKPEWKEFWNRRIMELHIESRNKALGMKFDDDSKPFKDAEVATFHDSHRTARDEPPSSRKKSPGRGDSRSRRKDSPSGPRDSRSGNSPFRRRESPTRRRESPPRRRESPPRRRESPTRRRESPTRRRESPPRRRESPPRRRESPPRRRESPTRRRESPTRRRESPTRRGNSPTRPRVSPTRRRESPTRRGNSPTRPRVSPTRRRESPTRRGNSPTRPRVSPTSRRESPTRRRDSPTRRRESPPRRRESPTRRRESPPRRRESPTRRRESPTRRRDPLTLVVESPSLRKEPSSNHIEPPSIRKDSPSRRRGSPPRSRGSPNPISRSNNNSCPPGKNRARDRSPVENDSKRQRMSNEISSSLEKSKEHPPNKERQNRRGSDTQSSDDGVIAVLRLLTAVEDNLGSLGPKVVDLLSEALSMECNRVNSSEDLLTDKNIILLITVKEKLKGQLQAGLVGRLQVEVFKNIIRAIEKLVERARKKQKRDESLNNFIMLPGVGGVERDKISREIVNTLLAQGRRDITEKELVQFIRDWVRKEFKTDSTTFDKDKRVLENKRPRDETGSLVLSVMNSLNKSTMEGRGRINIGSKFPSDTNMTNEFSRGSNTVEKAPNITRQNMMLHQPMGTQNYSSQTGNSSFSSVPFTRNSYDVTGYRNLDGKDISRENTNRVDLSTIRSSEGCSLSGSSSVNYLTPYFQMKLLNPSSSAMHSNMVGSSLRGDAYPAIPSLLSSNLNPLRSEAFNSRVDFRSGPVRYGVGYRGDLNSSQPKTNLRGTYDNSRRDNNKGARFSKNK